MSIREVKCHRSNYATSDDDYPGPRCPECGEWLSVSLGERVDGVKKHAKLIGHWASVPVYIDEHLPFESLREPGGKIHAMQTPDGVFASAEYVEGLKRHIEFTPTKKDKP